MRGQHPRREGHHASRKDDQRPRRTVPDVGQPGGHQTEHLVPSGLGPLPADFCRDVSDRRDINELYLAADVLVTDYSSVMFDFAVTGKPIVYFPYDLEDYRDAGRGFLLRPGGRGTRAAVPDDRGGRPRSERPRPAPGGTRGGLPAFPRHLLLPRRRPAAKRVVQRVFG